MKLRIWMLQLYELFLYLTTAKELKVDISTKQISVAPSSPQITRRHEIAQERPQRLANENDQKVTIVIVEDPSQFEWDMQRQGRNVQANIFAHHG